MDLKMRATNYHRTDGQSGRVITQGTEEIINDFKRLSTLPSDATKYLLFSYLPVFDDSYQHLKKQFDVISEETDLRVEDPDIRIELRNI